MAGHSLWLKTLKTAFTLVSMELTKLKLYGKGKRRYAISYIIDV